MTACPRCDTPLNDNDECPACSMGSEAERDYLDAPDQPDPRDETDDETDETEADQSAAWGDPRKPRGIYRENGR